MVILCAMQVRRTLQQVFKVRVTAAILAAIRCDAYWGFRLSPVLEPIYPSPWKKLLSLCFKTKYNSKRGFKNFSYFFSCLVTQHTAAPTVPFLSGGNVMWERKLGSARSSGGSKEIKGSSLGKKKKKRDVFCWLWYFLKLIFLSYPS